MQENVHPFKLDDKKWTTFLLTNVSSFRINASKFYILIKILSNDKLFYNARDKSFPFKRATLNGVYTSMISTNGSIISLNKVEKVLENELRTYSIELICVTNRFSRKWNEPRSVVEFHQNK